MRVRSALIDDDGRGEIAPARYKGHTQRFQYNVHASWMSREHTNVWDVDGMSASVREWLGALRCGDVLEVYAMAQYPGWLNFAEFVEVEVYCALT